MTDEDLVRCLQARSKDELVDLLMTLRAHDWPLQERIQRHLNAARDPGAGAELKNQLDRVLSIDFVEWDQVSAFVDELEQLHDDILAYSKVAAKSAMRLLLNFVTSLPPMFDRVHGEDEMSVFSDMLVASIVKLQATANVPVEEVVASLLRAYLAEDHGCLQTVPESLVELAGQGDADQVAACITTRVLPLADKSKELCLSVLLDEQ